MLQYVLHLNLRIPLESMENTSMKKIIGLLFTLGFMGLAHAAQWATNDPNGAPHSVRVASLPVGGGVTAFTQNLDLNTITQSNSAACRNPSLGHAANSYIRRFDLDGAEGLSKPIEVRKVNYAIETASSGSGSQPVTVNIYSIPNGSSLLFANMTLIASVDSTINDTQLTWTSAAISGEIDPSAFDLVVEIFTPDGQNDGNFLYIGSNAGGQTAPTYLAAADCGVPEPTDTAQLGFPDMHLLMTVEYRGLPSSVPSLSVWGLLILASLLSALGIRSWRNRI